MTMFLHDFYFAQRCKLRLANHSKIPPVKQFAKTLRSISLDDPLASRLSSKLQHVLEIICKFIQKTPGL